MNIIKTPSKNLLLFFIGLFFHIGAQATNAISCEGTISTIGVHDTDRVILRLSSMNTTVQICHLSQTIGSTYPITPDQCKLAYSTLLVAASTGKTINVYFDNVKTGNNCITFEPWEIATARWVHLDY